MRLISQDGTIDVPYEQAIVEYEACERNGEDVFHIIFAITEKSYFSIAKYSTESKAQKAMDMLRTAYTGRFVTNADISDDFNERLQELMKGGFGTVIVKDTNDSRVEFDNLNGYFQFPKDEDVEV